MIAFPKMLIPAAEKAGISIPDDPDNFEAAKDSHPHFYIFCVAQLCRPMTPIYEHWENAKVIASYSADKIMQVSLQDLVNEGFSYPNMDPEN